MYLRQKQQIAPKNVNNIFLCGKPQGQIREGSFEISGDALLGVAGDWQDEFGAWGKVPVVCRRHFPPTRSILCTHFHPHHTEGLVHNQEGWRV